MAIGKIGTHTPAQMLKINGDIKESLSTPPIEGKRAPTSTSKDPQQHTQPVEAPSDPYALQEHYYDQANRASMRGKEASRHIGQKTKSKHKRIVAIGDHGQEEQEDQHTNQGYDDLEDSAQQLPQEKFYRRATAAHEAHMAKERAQGKQPFSRRPAQVESEAPVHINETSPGLSLLSGETQQNNLPGYLDHEGDTVPQYMVSTIDTHNRPLFEDTAVLRKILGLKEKP